MKYAIIALIVLHTAAVAAPVEKLTDFDLTDRANLHEFALSYMFFAGIFGDVIHHPGAKKKPFMRPALDATVGAAVSQFQNPLTHSIN